MKNIRRGNDIRFRWQIRRGEDAESFDGKELKVLLRDQFGNSCDVEWSIANDGIISGVSRGKTQSKLGVYTLTLVENDGANDMATVDKISAWRLVAVQDASLVDDEATNDCGNISVEVIELESEIGLGSLPMSIDTELNPDSDNAIANSAVTKGINAVGEMTEEDLQEVVNNSSAYYPQKAKQKKQQIIIGRAIKPKACEIGNVENWYAFRACPVIACAVPIAEYKGFRANVFVRSLYENGYRQMETYCVKTSYDSRNYYLNIVSKFIVWNTLCRVDKYEKEKNVLNIWLTYKKLPTFVRNTEGTKELRYGYACSSVKAPSLEKIYFILRNRLVEKGEHKGLIRQIPYRYQIQRIRGKIGNRKCVYTGKNIKGCAKFNHSKYTINNRVQSGLYRCRVNKYGRQKSPWTYFYLRLIKDSSNDMSRFLILPSIKRGI